MNKEHVLEILKESTLEAVQKCRKIASYVLRGDTDGYRNGIIAYEREDEVVFKAFF